MPNVYTRSGDKGQTGLFGGNRISKDDIRVDAYGTMDEASSAIGMAHAATKDEDIKKILHRIQERILVLGAELASDEKGRSMLVDKITADDITFMEEKMDYYLRIVGPQKAFVIPGVNQSSAALHFARTVVRRGERRIVTYQGESPEEVRPEMVKFANRLSDLLFVLARTEELAEGIRQTAKKILEQNQEPLAEAPYTPQDYDHAEKLLVAAKRIAAGARVKAEAMKVPVVVAVVDKGGNLAYYERMEDSLLASIDIAINKAWTANALKIPTQIVNDLAKESSDLFGIQSTNQGRIVTFGGGFPLIVDGEQIGAIGISGGSVDQDVEIAKAGLKVLQ